MSKPLLIINEIEILSKQQLEDVIAELSEESKIALRLIFDQQLESLG